MGKQENLIQKQIIEYINKNLGVASRVNSGLAKGMHGRGMVHLAKKGTADILASIPETWFDKSGKPVKIGAYWAIECKSMGKSLMPEQILFRDEVQRSGGVFIMARSLEDFISQFLKHNT